MKPLKIVEHLDISIAKSSSMGLIGPNGAGKTTTIKLCAGIIRPQSGSVFLNGLPVSQSRARANIGLLTENQYIPPYLTLREWLEMLGSFSGISKQTIKKKVNEILGQFELIPMADSLVHTLSKGQVQRAGFAQAFLHEPEILILDEPMSGMDPVWRSRIQDLLMAYKNKGGTLLFSSHIMSDVLRLSDKIMVIGSGKVKWQGSLNQLMVSNPQFQVIFHTDNIKDLLKRLKLQNPKQQPDGSYLMVLDARNKDEVIRFSLNNHMELLSLTPVYPSIEALFA